MTKVWLWIKTSATTGTTDTISVNNNGSTSGTIYWTPDTAGTYYYICEYHASMTGTISVSPNTSTYAWNTGETSRTINVSPTITSGIRLGSSAATTRGFKSSEFQLLGNLIADVLYGFENNSPNYDVEKNVRKQILNLCNKFPIY